MGFKVSVIIPIYNEEKRLRDCLESLVNQTIGLEHLELILVDDASTDSTPDILREYEKKYPDNIMLIFCEENGKQGTALNIGMGYATGDWMAFMGADDQIHLQMLEILSKIAVASDAEMVTFKYSSDASILEADLTDADKAFRVMDITSIEERKNLVLRSDLINNSCTQKFYRTDLLQRTGSLYAERLDYEEPLFTYPLRYYVNRVALTELPLYYYHLNPEGTINRTLSDPSKILDHLSVQIQLLEFMRGKELYSTYYEEIELNFLHCFVYEPLLFLGGRGYEVPGSVNAFIAEKVNELVPRWRENTYLTRIPQEEQDYIHMILDN